MTRGNTAPLRNKNSQNFPGHRECMREETREGGSLAHDPKGHAKDVCVCQLLPGETGRQGGTTAGSNYVFKAPSAWCGTRTGEGRWLLLLSPAHASDAASVTKSSPGLRVCVRCPSRAG